MMLPTKTTTNIHCSKWFERLEEQTANTFNNEKYSDLIFMCCDGPVYSHQSLIAPLSPLLARLFRNYQCCSCQGRVCSQRERIQVQVEMERKVLLEILSIVYGGFVLLESLEAENRVRNGMKMLGINIVPSSLVNYQKNATKILPTPIVIQENEKEEHCSSKTKVVGKRKGLSKLTLKSRAIVDDDSEIATKNSSKNSFEKENKCSILFKCDICLREFKLRMALEHHKRRAHKKDESKGENGELEKENTNQNICFINGHKTTNDNSENVQTTSVEKIMEKCEEVELFCDFCNQKLRSEWFRPSERHKCSVSWFERKCKDTSGYITDVESEDELDLQTNPSEDRTERKRPGSRLSNQKSHRIVNVPSPRKKLKSRCQICRMDFDKYSSLRTHYTKQHYWSKLSEEFGTIGNKCYICYLEFPTLNHLVLHMGNFHSKIDGYLLADGYKVTTCEWTTKLLDLKCGICNSVKKTSAALKYHLSTHHFNQELNREFPSTTRKTKRCAKCNKVISGPNSFTILMGHLGGFHDEVLKYAYNFIVVSEDDKNVIPVNDFEDNVVGTPFSNPDFSEILNKIKDSPKRKRTEVNQPGIHRKQNKKIRTTAILQCQICEMTFSEYATMKTHYTKDHFWAKLTSDYLDWSSDCNICLISFPTTDHLLQHMGNFHTALTLDKYLESQGNLPLTVEWTAKIKNLKCSICDVEKKSSPLLKSHLAINHFSAELNREFPAGKGKNKKCWKCSKVFSGPGSLSLRTGHLGSFHDEVLKYAAGFVEVDEVYRNIIPINDFEEIVKTISFRLQGTEEKSELKLMTPTKYRIEKSNATTNHETGDVTLKVDYMNELDLRASPTLENYDLDGCYLCNKNFTSENADAILKHMSSHYKLELQRNYIDRPESAWILNKQCPKCDKYVETADQFVMHMGVIHKQVLQYIPERLKSTFTKTKVMKDPTFICPLEYCDRSCETRQQLLIHLLMSHYEEKITKEFGTASETNDGQCIICDKKLPLNRTGYLKHIGVDHELVIEYLEKDASVRYIPLEIYKKQTDASPGKSKLADPGTEALYKSDKNPEEKDIRSCFDSDSE